MEQSSQGVNPIEWSTEDSAPCSMKKCTLLFATGSNQKYGFPYSLHREVAAVVVAAVPQMLAWRPWWLWPPWPLCRNCWRGSCGGRGLCAANAGAEAAVVVAAVPQMLAWWPRWSWPLCCKCISGMPILYHMMALRLLGYLKSIAFSSLLGSV